MNSKIIQISTGTLREYNGVNIVEVTMVIALCENGSIWTKKLSDKTNNWENYSGPYKYHLR